MEEMNYGEMESSIAIATMNADRARLFAIMARVGGEDEKALLRISALLSDEINEATSNHNRFRRL